MYGIFTNICPINDPNVGKYTSTMEHMGYVSFSVCALVGMYMVCGLKCFFLGMGG
jgi:hypothetical protein